MKKIRLADKAEYNAKNFVISSPTGTKTSVKEESKDTWGPLGGVLYLGEKLLTGFVSSFEGAVDYVGSGFAKLIGNDEWAEEIISEDWFGDWYSHPEEWFNPSDGWKMAGDVAGGIGTSVPALGIALATHGAAIPTFAAAALPAAGRSTQEAYKKTGELGAEEFGYGLVSGTVEGGLETVTNLIGMGTGTLIKSFSKSFAKEAGEAAVKEGFLKTIGKSFIGEAFEESTSEFLDPYIKRATYDGQAENATADQIIYSGLVGGLSGAVMGGGGYGINTGNSFIKGNKLSGNGGDVEVLDTSSYIADYAEKNGIDEGLFSEIANTRKSLVESMIMTGNKAQSITQKTQLGSLSRLNAQAAQSMFVARRAQGIINNADKIAKRLSEYGYKDSEGKAMTFTAEEITAGYDPKKPSSIYKALRENSKLRTLAVADAAGALILDTSKFTHATLTGKALASKVDLNRFRETATPEEIKAVSEALKIESWEGLTPDSFAEKIGDYVAGGGVQQALHAKELKASFKTAEPSQAFKIPKLVVMNKDGVRRYTDGNIDIGISKEGEAYRVYNYKNDSLTKEMSKSDVNEILRSYNGEKLAVLEAQEAQLREYERLQAEAKEIDTYARDNIKEYKTLNAPNQSMIRKVIREGRANGINDSDLLMYAKISAHSGIDIAFSKEANAIQNSKFGIRNSESENGRQYAIKIDVNGNKFVEVDSRTVKATDSTDKIGKILSDIVRTRFNEFVEVNGQKIGINQKTAREWVYSKSAQTLLDYNKQAFLDKANAFGNADEILKSTQNYIGEAIKHSRKDNFVEFARGVVSFSLDGRGYEADVIVGTTKTGAAVLYDLVDIQNKKIVAYTSYTIQDRRSNASATTNSIHQNGKKVNINSEKNHALGENSEYADGYYDASRNLVVVNPEATRSAERLLIHELDHAIRKDMNSKFKIRNSEFEATKKKIDENYAESERNAEYFAFYSEKMLTNKNTLEKLLEAEPTLKEKILNFFKGASQDYADVPKLSGAAKKYYRTYKKLFDEFSRRNAENNAIDTMSSSSTASGPPSPILGKANAAENAHLSTLSAENAQKTPLTNMKQENMNVSGRQYAALGDIEGQINNYQKRVDAWDKTTEGFSFVMGETPSYLSEMIVGEKKIGKRQVRIDASKMKKIIKDHPEMSIDVLKQLPYLLNDPVLVMDSKTVSGRLVLLGDVYANGKVVSMILEINPSTRSGKTTYVNVMKVASAHTRSNIQNLINSSNIRYVAENENRVNKWLKVNRLQLPLPNSHSDSATVIIPENAENVKLNGEKTSDKQYALPIDDESDSISGAEVMSWLKKPESVNDAKTEAKKVDKQEAKTETKEAMAKAIAEERAQMTEKSKKAVADAKAKAETKAQKTVERGRKALEAEKSRLKADYGTDRVYNEKSIEERLYDKVKEFKYLKNDVKERLVRDLFLALNESNGAEWRKTVEIEHTVKIVDEILHNPNSNYDFTNPSDRQRLNESVSKVVSGIAKSGRLSEAVKLEKRLKQEAKTEANAKQKILEGIHQTLKKIDDIKKKRFMSASSYKSAEFGKTIEKLTTMEWRSGFSSNIARERMEELSGWYTADNPMLFPPKNDENSFSKATAEYNPAIAGRLKMLSEGEGDYTVKELQELSNVISYFTKLVDEYDKVYIEGMWQDGMELSNKIRKEIKNQEKVGVPWSIRALRNKFTSLGFRTYGDPLSVMKLADMYGDGIFVKYYNEWMNGEINAEAEAKKIKAKYDEFMKANRKYLKNAETETVKLHGQDVRKIDLISYAMTLKREQAWESIANGGVVFIDPKYENKVTLKPINVDEGDGYKARLKAAIEAEQKAVMSMLSDTDIKYMKILEEGFELAKVAKVMGDMQRLGFVNVIDGYYYPVRHAYTEHISDFNAELIATDRYANASFNKSTTEEANSAILIRSADTTFNSHVNGVSRYLYLSPVMDSFNKLYKLKVGESSIQRTIEESKTAWRDNGKLVGFDYLQNLMLDTMGLGKSVGDDFFAKIRGGAVTFALGANPKVLVTQLSSIIASTNVLSWRSHVAGLKNWSGDMDKYSSVAALRNNDYTIAKAEGVVERINTWSRVFTAGISLMDRFVVYRAWAACQEEVARNGGPAVGTEANKIEAGKLLDKVILETQQNSFTSRRTEGARRGNVFVKSFQMYKSDSITNFGRAVDGWGEVHYLKALLKSDALNANERKAAEAKLEEAKKHLGKAIGSIAEQAIFMMLITEMFRNFYGKNDDETEEEKRTRLVVDGLGNLYSGIPILSEIHSTLTSNYGFDTMEYSALNDFFDTAKAAMDYAGKAFDGTADKREGARFTQNLLYSAGQLVGVPVRNIKNLSYGVVRMFSKDAAYKWDNALYKKNYSADLNEAVAKGDIDRAMMIMELALGEKLGSGFSDGSIKELTRLSGLGEKVTPSAISDSITVNGEEYVLDKDQYNAVKAEYNNVISGVNSFIKSEFYKKLNDEQKATVLRKVYSTYKDIAYDTVLGTGRNDKALIMSKLLPENVFNAYLSLNVYESDKDREGKTIAGSKRAKVVKAINSLGVSANERLLLICASGYSLKDGDIRGLSAEAAKSRLLKYILSLRGVSAAEKAEIAEMCGFEVKNGKIVRSSAGEMPKLKVN